jgi:Bacteriocin-protection, YdeI or OmpD-Associated/Domain of unknown function (DUF1905)
VTDRAPDRAPVRFSAILRPTEHGAFIELPPQAIERLRARGRTSVTGRLDGEPLVGQVMPYVFEGEGRKVVLGVTKQMRAAIGKSIGESVQVELLRDDAPRAVEVPAELQAALDRYPPAADAWHALAPSHRNEHAAFVAEAKQPATRERRARQTIDRLPGTKRGAG